MDVAGVSKQVTVAMAGREGRYLVEGFGGGVKRQGTL